MVGKVFPTKTDIAKKLVGTYIDEDCAHHLSLISLIDDKSKSNILTGLITEYLSKKNPVPVLIQIAAEKASHNWAINGWRGQKSTAAFKSYIAATKKDLIRHRIAPDMIQKIIKEIKRNG